MAEAPFANCLCGCAGRGLHHIVSLFAIAMLSREQTPRRKPEDSEGLRTFNKKQFKSKFAALLALQ